MTDTRKNKDQKINLQDTRKILNGYKSILSLGIQIVFAIAYTQLSATVNNLADKGIVNYPILIKREWVPDRKRSTGNFAQSLHQSGTFNGIISGYNKTSRLLGLAAPIIATQMEFAQEYTDPWDIFAYWTGYLAMIGVDVALLSAVKKKVYNSVLDKLIEENGNDVKALAKICKEIRALNKEAEELNWYQYDPKSVKANLECLLELSKVLEDRIKSLEFQEKDIQTQPI